MQHKEALVDILRKAISEALWNVEIMSKTMDVPNENEIILWMIIMNYLQPLDTG